MGKAESFTQLTAPGVTAVIPARGNVRHTFGYTLALVDTNVTVQAEGTIDGDNFFPLKAAETKTANGTYGIIVDAAVVAVRFNWTAETGGTAATIDADYYGSPQ